MKNKEVTRRERIDGAKVIQVIEISFIRGKGIEGDIVRACKQYWDFEGNLLAEFDPEKELL